jgi:hypothetical protein
VDKNTKFDRRRLPPTFLSVQLTKSSVSFITQEPCMCVCVGSASVMCQIIRRSGFRTDLGFLEPKIKNLVHCWIKRKGIVPLKTQCFLIQAFIVDFQAHGRFSTANILSDLKPF